MMVKRPTAEHTVRPTVGNVESVLSYWLSSLRLQEALQNRPRAQRRDGAALPRLDAPSSGQDYFKVPLDTTLAALINSGAPYHKPFDAELSAFFESWLGQEYRRGEEESEAAHLLCFPVVHLARGELAGLLRWNVGLSFASEQGLFRPPTRRQRREGSYPPAPSEARLFRREHKEKSWPFFIDTRLLSYPLGLSNDAIDRLFGRLRALDALGEAEMLRMVAETLRQACAGDDDPLRAACAEEDTDPAELHALLLDLTQSMGRLLARSAARASVYPVGIVLDGSRAKTTYHLQRDLRTLLEEGARTTRERRCTLGSYLLGETLAFAEDSQRALCTGPALTAHQRRAAERIWGSPLTSVQGPPGTGKTTLILHLCAEALVRKVESLMAGGSMGEELLLITSSNNRAVDNVLDGLRGVGSLPLALRVGSRQVCEEQLAAQLREALAWLSRAESTPPELRQVALTASLDAFRAQHEKAEQLLAPVRQARAEATEREVLIRELAALRTGPAAMQSANVALSPEQTRSLLAALLIVEQRMTALSGMCEAKPSMVQVNAIARHYEQTAERHLPELEAALRSAGMQLELPLPPLLTPLNVTELMEAWEDGAELLLQRLTSLRERLQEVHDAQQRSQRLATLQGRLTWLKEREKSLDVQPSKLDDELGRALFTLAIEVREAWARVQATELRSALQAALNAVEQERSLRPLFRDHPHQATFLCRLFGVWGSTLLSIANVLPSDPHSVTRVVIDEAGQCHPAHAVSALMRCKSALIIGDVHQLEPVVDVTRDDDGRLLRKLGLAADLMEPYRVYADSQVSAQSLADRAAPDRLRLRDHFRCHPSIIAISDTLCSYGLEVHTQPRATSTYLPHPVCMVDVAGSEERQAGSLFNPAEAEELLARVERLLAMGVSPCEVAVITPYRGQLQELRRGLWQLGVPIEASPEMSELGPGDKPSHAGVALGTVHRFQGGERAIVLFSSVVTRVGSLPFLNARPNLLNVAVSRAKQHFVCIGQRDVLMRGAITKQLTDAAHLVQPLRRAQ